MSSQTKIKSILVENVRGISSKKFIFDTPEMLGNKFHLLVAPNGFGKSSFAGAFSSLLPKSLKLPKSLLHNEDEANSARIELTYSVGGGPDTIVQADAASNTISKVFSVAVINSKLKPHATAKSGFEQFVKATASLIVEPIVIVERIPSQPPDAISTSGFKQPFGRVGKILPNIHAFLENDLFLGRILALPGMGKFTQKTVWKQIDQVVDDIKNQSGKADQIVTWIEQNKLPALRAIPELTAISAVVADFSDLSETASFLVAYQFAQAYRDHKKLLNAYRVWYAYVRGKNRCKELLASINSNPDWIKITIRETGGKLVVQLPVATRMSNGQRDLFSFVAQLMRAEFELEGARAILIVDEVFDYLDECNLLAAQFYISKFVEQFKSSGAEIFPMFLTHLDPNVFKHSALGLGKKDIRKVHLLDKATESDRKFGVAKMVRLRDEAVLKPYIGKYFFHYHPANCDQKALFQANNLKESWGESHLFYRYAFGELRKYCSNDAQVDFVAACVATRVAIEKYAFDQLQEPSQKVRFTDEFDKGTSDKLDYVESAGGHVPESHRLLGLLYNDMLHHKEHFDYISAIVSKMKNAAIRGMIKEIPIPTTF